METVNLIFGLIALGAGAAFLGNRKPIAKGMSEFYRKFYSEKNTQVIVVLISILLILIGVVIITQGPQ